MMNSGTLRKTIKYIVFAIVCAAVILPSLAIGYFQAERFTREKFELFEQHVETIVRQIQRGALTPQAALEVLQVHELVLWGRFIRNDTAVFQTGVFSNRNANRTITVKDVDPRLPLKGQIPQPQPFFQDDNNIYRVIIPLRQASRLNDVLEVGIWYEPLAGLRQNGLSLSLVLFGSALVFLLGVYVFIDTYLIAIFEKLAQGFTDEKLAANSPGIQREDAPFFSPSIRNLERALRKHSTLLNDERTARETMETFVTELNRQLAEQKAKLEETHRQLLQSSKLAAVGELAGGVAHEINNPNGVILAGAKYLQNRLQNESPAQPAYVHTYLDRIVRQSTRIGEIVNALLTFSRRRPKEKQLMHLNESIGDAIDVMAHRLRNVKFENNISKEIPRITGNRNEIAQVFLNVFSNAVDAMPEGGSLEVWAETERDHQENRWIKISIHNTGPDIPVENLQKVMQPFFTTKSVGKGTGLGLSVSLGIIEDHGGTMKVKNHPSGGAVFEITLPIEKGPPATTAQI